MLVVEMQLNKLAEPTAVVIAGGFSVAECL